MSEKSKNILRKALQREHAPKPDVDEAWQDLSARLHLSSPVAEEEKHTTHKLKWISYALKGISDYRNNSPRRPLVFPKHPVINIPSFFDRSFSNSSTSRDKDGPS